MALHVEARGGKRRACRMLPQNKVAPRKNKVGL